MALKVLLADDNITAQKMGSKILIEAGYTVVAVSNGAAAVKKIASEKPDFAILDVFMPGFNGLEVCEKVKNASETARMPVLLTVTNMEPYSAADGNRVKADGVLIKPFEATDMLAVLRKLEEKLQSMPPPPEIEPEAQQAEELEVSTHQEIAIPREELPQDVASAPAMGTEHLDREDAPPSSFAVEPPPAAVSESVVVIEGARATASEPEPSFSAQPPAAEPEAVVATEPLAEVAEEAEPAGPAIGTSSATWQEEQEEEEEAPAAEPAMEAEAEAEPAASFTADAPVESAVDMETPAEPSTDISAAREYAPNAVPDAETSDEFVPAADVVPEIDSPAQFEYRSSASEPGEEFTPALEAAPAIEPPAELEYTSAPPVVVEVAPAAELEPEEQTVSQVAVMQDPALATTPEEIAQFATEFVAEPADEVPVRIAVEPPAEPWHESSAAREESDAPPPAPSEDMVALAGAAPHAYPILEAAAAEPAREPLVEPESEPEPEYDTQRVHAMAEAPEPEAEFPAMASPAPLDEFRAQAEPERQVTTEQTPAEDSVFQRLYAPLPQAPDIQEALVAQFTEELDRAHAEAVPQPAPVEPGPVEHDMEPPAAAATTAAGDDHVAQAVQRVLERYKGELIAAIVRELKS